MRIISIARLCAFWAVACLDAHAQVLLVEDFDSASSLFYYSFDWGFGGYGAFPVITATNIDLGSPHGHVMRVNLDSSQTQVIWTWLRCLPTWPKTRPAVTFDPTHTFLKFDVSASKLRPVHVRLEYIGTSGMDLDVDLNLSLAGVFQTFVLPLSDFTTNNMIVISGNTIPQFPTSVDFGIHGDPADPTNTWPPAVDNMYMVDNISYILQPPLSIEASTNAVVLSWPTNTSSFVLQQAVDLSGWAAVTNAPVVTNGVNQVSLPADIAQSFYRLSLVGDTGSN